MLSGLKFVPRDQIDKAQGEVSDNSVRDRKKLDSSTEKRMRRKKKTSSYSSSDDEEIERLKKGSKKKKWYSSDECSSSYSSESESESGSSYKLDGKKRCSRKKGRRSKDESSGDEADDRLNKRSRSKRKNQSSDLYSSSASESEGSDDISGKKDRRQRGRKKYELSRSKKRDHAEEIGEDDINDDSRGSQSLNNMDSARKEMGLEWMLSAKNVVRKSLTSDDHEPEELPTDEIKKTNPKELNPYLKDNGSGYPEDEDGRKAGGKELLPSSVVGDGGASWRLKALKRAQEQAAREGRKLEEVVGERWGSLGHLAVSVASGAAAPSRAHLHAIKNRKRGETEDCQTAAENQNERNSEKHFSRDYLKDISVRHPNMRAPKVHDSLSWGKRRNHNLSAKDATLVSSAVGSLNKFTNDGNFLREFNGQQNSNPDISIGSSLVRSEKLVESKLELSETNKSSGGSLKQDLSANQLAAKALQLRLKGKHEEAQELMKEAENIRANQTAVSESIRPQNDGGTSRYFMPNMSAKQKEDDSDIYLARKIAQNKQYSISGQADDEYDFDDGPRRKNRKKGGSSDRNVNENSIAKRILTQQERCQFCFENPSRPKHLVISIANFTYLMLPQWQPVVPGHCCILPMQHEAATRTVDNNVWEEIRNFKKCLIMMFAEQEKDVVFLETVMGLAQQRRHCLIECIPLPRDIAKEAPLYFKKAIDEAEDEWSQHNAKRLIDTSQKGLRGSIPKDFPYFHVEFGLNRGFVHVIDDEKQFKSSLGLNVIRGMLELPDEDMHRRRRHELIEAQKKAVASFSRDWEPFDWTKQLN